MPAEQVSKSETALTKIWLGGRLVSCHKGQVKMFIYCFSFLTFYSSQTFFATRIKENP